MSFSVLFYALIAGVVPSFIWLFFWTREDAHHPEPKWLIAGCFLAGAVAVIIAAISEGYVSKIIDDISIKYTVWAAIEEIIKFCVVAVVALRSMHNDEPIDAMVYSIVVALGFAALENMLFIIGPISNGEIAQSIITSNMRFIGATLVHVVCSSLAGFTLGYAFYKGRIAKTFAVIIGLLAAIALHAAFNLSIISMEASDTLKSFAWVWGAVVIMIILFEEVKIVRPKLL